MGVTPFSLFNPKEQRADKELQFERIDICKSCDDLIPKVNVCKNCGCVMPFKVTLQDAKCPLNKW